MSPTTLAYRVLTLVPLLLSLGVHEWAHAATAFALGDPTAEEQGRRTLNPLAHVDPIGTLLLPLLGVPFGWAKPVPVDPTRFRENVPMRRGMLLTAAAGPLSNLVLACLCGAAMALVTQRAPGLWAARPAVAFLLTDLLVVNVALAIFNVLPVPPLDGGRIVESLVPFEWRGVWERVSAQGRVIVLLLLVAPGLFGASPLGWITSLAARLMSTSGP
jgi:Zn-dependent protease